jgi:hypothetical protein
MTVNSDQNIDLLSQIYKEMDETGKEKLKEVSKQIKIIWDIVNEGAGDNVNITTK